MASASVLLNSANADDYAELFDVVDKNNKPIRKASREVVHRDALLHRSTHVFIFRMGSQGPEVLVQQRSAKKMVGANLWDLSVAEHLSAGENYLEAAIRGIREELNLTVSPARLTEIRSVYLSKQDYEEVGVRDHLFTNTFAMAYDPTDGEITQDNVEVQQVEWWTVTKINEYTRKQRNLLTRWFALEIDNLNLTDASNKVLQSACSS